MPSSDVPRLFLAACAAFAANHASLIGLLVPAAPLATLAAKLCASRLLPTASLSSLRLDRLILLVGCHIW
jgi:hypothetical protein